MAAAFRDTFQLTSFFGDTRLNGEVHMAATLATQHTDAEKDDLIGFDEAMHQLSREDRFRATVYAMNTLLVQKGVYSPEEFEFQFRQFAQKNLKRG